MSMIVTNFLPNVHPRSLQAGLDDLPTFEIKGDLTDKKSVEDQVQRRSEEVVKALITG
ncbi:hypothetical protein ACFLUK_03010 [Chloroflexota bacterium]